jgi:hypothetical protein
MRAQIEHVAMFFGQESLHRLFQSKDGVIRTDGNAYRSPRLRDLVLCSSDDVGGSEAKLLL